MMRMKRNLRLIGAAVVVALLAFFSTSCMSMAVGMMKSMYKDYGVYDTSVSADQLCEFRFVGVNITSFNGKPVSWGDKANNMGYIKLPAGTHDFVYDYVKEETELTDYDYNYYTGIATWTYTTTKTNASDLEIPKITLLPGHKYSLSGVSVTGNIMIFMQDVTNMPSGMFGDEVADAPKVSKTTTELDGIWKASDGTSFTFSGNTWEMFIPQGSYMGTPATPEEGANQKGTFEISGNKVTMYLTEVGMGGRFGNVSALKQATIYTYSLADKTLMLEVEYLMPNMAYSKQ